MTDRGSPCPSFYARLMPDQVSSIVATSLHADGIRVSADSPVRVRDDIRDVRVDNHLRGALALLGRPS